MMAILQSHFQSHLHSARNSNGRRSWTRRAAAGDRTSTTGTTRTTRTTMTMCLRISVRCVWRVACGVLRVACGTATAAVGVVGITETVASRRVASHCGRTERQSDGTERHVITACGRQAVAAKLSSRHLHGSFSVARKLSSRGKLHGMRRAKQMDQKLNWSRDGDKAAVNERSHYCCM